MKKLTIGLFALLLAGCMTGERVKDLHEGMSKPEVIALLGQPDGYQHTGNVEALKYANRYMSSWGYDKSDYYVMLRDGKVTEYGNGTVRTSGPNIVTVLPLR